MCLCKISNRAPRKTGFGYKVYKSRADGKLYSETYNLNGIRAVLEPTTVNLGHSYQSSKKTIYTDTYESYESGFHIFLDMRDALLWTGGECVVVKVKYDNAKVEGKQSLWDYGYVVVADNVTLLEIVTEEQSKGIL